MDIRIEHTNRQPYVDNMYVSEKALNQLPHKSHIAETRKLLRDFCINTTIPEFESLSCLYRWRREMINSNYAKDQTLLKAGRKHKMSIDDFKPYYEKYLNKQITRKEITCELQISMSTFHCLMRRSAKSAIPSITEQKARATQ